MSTYVLVHARWLGAWCWDAVAARLRAAGDTVVTPDHAGFDEIRAAVEGAPEPVVLVGHSSSGMIISALAELVPDRIRLLVYVSAFLLPDGVTPPDIGRTDEESILADHLVVRDGTLSVTDPEEVFFNDLPPAEAKAAAGRLVTEPLAPPAGPPVTLTDAGFGRVPRAYVACDADRALGPAAQRRMYTALPCLHVYHLPAGHAPFLSVPDALAADLRDAATRVTPP